jgi:signal transduction histidine kinase
MRERICRNASRAGCAKKEAAPMRTDSQEPIDLRRQLAELLQEQHALAERMQEGQAYFRQVARSVWRVQEEERSRLARELHDGVGHNLTAMAHLIAEALSTLPATAESESARSTLARAREIADSTLQDTRALSRLLRPQILDDLGLEPAMHWLVRSFSETHGLGIHLDFRAARHGLDTDRCTLVFRIAQEALANIAKHAGAARVDIVFDSRDGYADLLVHDDGRGCNVDAAIASSSEGSSSGLGGMRDRVRLFGGSLRIDSTPGAGFGVSVRFPLSDAPGGANP